MRLNAVRLPLLPKCGPLAAPPGSHPPPLRDPSLPRDLTGSATDVAAATAAASQLQ